jgi:hypothetical protein
MNTPFGSMDLSLNDLEGAATPAPAPTSAAATLELKKWLFERRLDYGWNFFNLEADQRMKMFNFFLLFVGFIVAGYATLLANGCLLLSAALACIAGYLTWCFICLDRRNEELVHIAGDILGSLESDVLFTGYDRPILWPRRRGLSGKMDCESEPWRPIERPVGIFRRENADNYGNAREQLVDKEYEPCPSVFLARDGRSPYEHGKYIPRLQKGVLALFLILALLPWTPSGITICGHAIPLKVETRK